MFELVCITIVIAALSAFLIYSIVGSADERANANKFKHLNNETLQSYE